MFKKDNLFIYFAGAVLSFNVAATSAVVPSIALTFSATPIVAGKVVWFYMLAYGIFSLLYVPLCRYVSIKLVFLISFFLFSMANLFSGIALSLGQMLVFRFLMGSFGAAIVPLTLFVLGSGVRKNKRGKSVGLFFSFTFASSITGIFLSGIINWRYLYILPGILGILASGIGLFVFNLPRDAAKSLGGFNYLKAIKDRRVYVIFTYIFLISFLYHSVRQWLGVYFYETFSFSQFIISSLLLCSAIAGILGEYLGGILSDSLGRKSTLNLGTFIMILSLGLLLVKSISSRVYLSLVMACFGLGWTFNHIGLSALITDLPKNLLSYAAGINSSVRFLAAGAGTFFSGIIIEKSGFLLLFILVIISLGFLYLFSKDLEEEEVVYGA